MIMNFIQRCTLALCILSCAITTNAMEQKKTIQEILQENNHLIDKAFKEIDDIVSKEQHEREIIQSALVAAHQQTLFNHKITQKLLEKDKQQSLNKKSQPQHTFDAYFSFLVTLRACTWAQKFANKSIEHASKTPIKSNPFNKKDITFKNALRTAQNPSLNDYFASIPQKKQHSLMTETNVLNDFFPNYFAPNIIIALEKQLPHAPYRCECEIAHFTKLLRQIYPDTIPVSEKCLIHLQNQIKIQTYNFDFATNHKNIQETIKECQFLCGEKHKPLPESKNPYFDAERDFVVPRFITIVTQKHTDTEAKGMLTALKNCIEGSKNKDFIEHMQPAIKKINNALNGI